MTAWRLFAPAIVALSVLFGPGCTGLKRKPHLDGSADVGPARDGATEGRSDSAGADLACVGTISCGQGACARTVQACMNGQRQTCTPGTPTTETCNGVDDDCNSLVDDGSPTTLCPLTSQAATACISGGCMISTCSAGTFDVDGQFGNGCECMDDLNAAACAMPTNLGSMNAGDPTITAIGRVPDANASDWFQIQFPLNNLASLLGTGTVDIKLSVNEDDAFRLEIKADCGDQQLGCMAEGGSATGITEWQFTDNCQGDGNPGRCSSRNVAWPSTVIFRVFRRTPGASCASYNVVITR